MGQWEDGYRAGWRDAVREASEFGRPLRLEPYRKVSKPRSSSPRPRRAGKKDPKMARALRKANAMGRKKNGSLKKGWSQGKIMKKAHALKKRMR